jgi:glycosyltransferase involved in cell wall biosynthesis
VDNDRLAAMGLIWIAGRRKYNMAPRFRFLFLEPFFGGSHRDFAEGLIAHTRHKIELITLPDRFWKWRMRGAALYLHAKINSPESFDGIILSSLMSLADLKALWGDRCPPALVYFHENQLSYPLAAGEAMDYQFGFTNISTALCAQRILFNSNTHLESFLSALPDFIRMMPDCRPNWIKSAIKEKAAVIYPGCHFAGVGSVAPTHEDGPPLVIWNHRWEHDKNPESFFSALTAMQHCGLDFRLAVMGKTYIHTPPIFETAKTQFNKHIVQWGYVPTRHAYQQWLGRGKTVISTALQENFGISVVEAIRHGCLPLLPNRLCYPEILPEMFHEDFLYSSQTDLEEKLAILLTGGDEWQAKRHLLAEHMGRYAWERAIRQFDEELAQLITNH